MGNSPSIRRFKVNPVEVVIFLIVTVVCAHSVYNLFYESPTFKASALTPMAANPISEGRSPASVAATPSKENIEIDCTDNQERQSTASKIRLIGKLCGLMDPDDAKKLMKISIVNNANKFNATIFTEQNAGKFSTDYIPLNSGENPVHLEFSYRGGRIYSQDMKIRR